MRSSQINLIYHIYQWIWYLCLCIDNYETKWRLLPVWFFSECIHCMYRKLLLDCDMTESCYEKLFSCENDKAFVCTRFLFNPAKIYVWMDYKLKCMSISYCIICPDTFKRITYFNVDRIVGNLFCVKYRLTVFTFMYVSML